MDNDIATAKFLRVGLHGSEFVLTTTYFRRQNMSNLPTQSTQQYTYNICLAGCSNYHHHHHHPSNCST